MKIKMIDLELWRLTERERENELCVCVCVCVCAELGSISHASTPEWIEKHQKGSSITSPSASRKFTSPASFEFWIELFQQQVRLLFRHCVLCVHKILVWKDHLTPATASLIANVSATCGCGVRSYGQRAQCCDRDDSVGYDGATTGKHPSPCPDTLARTRRSSLRCPQTSIMWSAAEWVRQTMTMHSDCLAIRTKNAM